MNIFVNDRNFSVVQNGNKKRVYCFSYENTLAIYDKETKKIIYKMENMTETNKKHLSIFKKFIDNEL